MERFHRYLGYPSLVEIAKLGANWDSYGGEPISDACLDYAIWLMQQMPRWWTPVPCSDGSIQLERHAAGMEFVLTIRKAENKSSGPTA